MASKENQEALENLSDYAEMGSSTWDSKNDNESISKSKQALQQAIDDLQIKNVALERACSMVSFYEGMDYKYFVEKYVKEAKKDIKELEELENGKNNTREN